MMIRKLTDKVGEAAQDKPLQTVAMALAAGYLLGGGLFSPLTARLLGIGVRVGLRFAALPMITQGVSRMVGQRDRHQEAPAV